jgi:hypothetical protein
MESEIFIKLTPADYRRLRSETAPGSPAQDAISKATPIEHALEGVEFSGYTVPCSAEQVRLLLETAKQCCPGAVADIERAIKLARAE